MARNTRSSFKIEADRVKIAKMYLQGLTQAAIAEDMGMTQQMVSYDLKAIQKDWRESAIDDIGTLRGRELARIDMLEVEYWESWERSKEEVTKARRSIKGDEVVAQSIERATTSGNPAFLQGIQWCIAQRCKILGLYQPTSRLIGVSETQDGDGSRQIEAFDISVLDAEQLRNYLAIVQAMKSGAQQEDYKVIDGQRVDG